MRTVVAFGGEKKETARLVIIKRTLFPHSLVRLISLKETGKLIYYVSLSDMMANWRKLVRLEPKRDSLSDFQVVLFFSCSLPWILWLFGKPCISLPSPSPPPLSLLSRPFSPSPSLPPPYDCLSNRFGAYLLSIEDDDPLTPAEITPGTILTVSYKGPKYSWFGIDIIDSTRI